MTTLPNYETNFFIQLLKMRNPWASETYNGLWNDSDERWTKDLKEGIDHKAQDGSVFFVTPSDFK